MSLNGEQRVVNPPINPLTKAYVVNGKSAIYLARLIAFFAFL
jgi:hypothetical protein